MLHAGTLLVAGFTFVYARLVCTFICSLPPDELARNTAIVGMLHVALREALLRVELARKGRTARRMYLLSVVTWLIAGATAIGLHAALYPNFPVGSHLKFAIGYWVLGGGIVAQIEYLVFERAQPDDAPSATRLRERLGRRLIEGYVVFTAAPALVLMLTLMRVVGEYGGMGQFVLEAAFLAVSFTGLALTAALAFGRSLRRDSEQLLDAVRRVGGGEFHIEVSTSRSDELSLVAAGIKDMASGLLLRERIREAFGRFVSPEVASEFIETYAREGRAAELGGKRRDVAIVLCDLRGFTPLSEALAPEQLIEILNGYFAEMVVAIQSHGGMVDKFIGDAVLAVFGLTARAPGDEPAVAAVRAAMAMLARLAAYNERLAPRGIRLQAGIGVHAGEVIAGYLGSAERLEFTVIGPNVNITARIEGEARAPRPSLLFSEEVARRIGDALAVEEVDTVTLKGVGERVKLFTVAAPQASD